MTQSLGTESRHQLGADTQVIRYYMLLAALLIAAASYWVPWVNHRAAALRLTGQDMGEFVKFLPASQEAAKDVGGGSVAERRIPRQLHYIAPFVSTVCLTLLAANMRIAFPRWLRVAVFASAALLLLGLLPPVWGHPKELLSGEFRVQGYAIILGALLALGHGMYRKIPVRWLAFTISVFSLAALALAQGAFWLVRSRLWAAYNTSTLSLGWGLWLHITAWAAALGLGAYIYVSK